MSFITLAFILIGLIIVAGLYDLVITKSFQLGGKSYTTQQTQSYGGLDAIEETISISWSGVLTTRSSNTAGVVTLNSASQPFITGNKADVYWQDANGNWLVQTYSSLTVAGQAATLASGAGTNLPTQNTVVYLSLVQSFTFNTIGNQSVALLGAADQASCSIVLLGTGGSVILLTIFLQPNVDYDWLSSSGVANPLSGQTVDTIRMTQTDQNTAHSVRFASQLNI